MDKVNETGMLPYQSCFNTDLNWLLCASEDDIEYIEQNHWGDLLVEHNVFGHERFRLWRNLDCNIMQGSPRIEIEYSGQDNMYRWETIYKL